MVLSLVDPNRVYLIGENSILRLQSEQGGDDLTICSFWRVLVSPEGPGHALFVRSRALGNEVRIYGDSEAAARWLQDLESLMRPFFADKATPVRPARFDRRREAQIYVEHVATGDGQLRLEWRDLGEPFMTRLEPDNEFVGVWSVYSCLVPARAASFEVEGRSAAGEAFPDSVAGHPTSTCFLALGETWLYPQARLPRAA
jgi:hypothetical protein